MGGGGDTFRQACSPDDGVSSGLVEHYSIPGSIVGHIYYRLQYIDFGGLYGVYCGMGSQEFPENMKTHSARAKTDGVKLNTVQGLQTVGQTMRTSILCIRIATQHIQCKV